MWYAPPQQEQDDHRHPRHDVIHCGSSCCAIFYRNSSLTYYCQLTMYTVAVGSRRHYRTHAAIDDDDDDGQLLGSWTRMPSGLPKPA